ncbi:hypothetical protein GTA08_BOTSDO02905 [Botryosphaeria dothidea]|uniref:Uncharacterized protein n=1 Tax=Botryosphaeria dothidea TaxID=55169 RepID=A0A8H4J050_9PEZI|nr:hypothetical protein GTA08_BOTSDO02905 [Botryosphaeria dothidea]
MGQEAPFGGAQEAPPASSAKKRSARDLEREYPRHIRESTPTLFNIYESSLPKKILREKYGYAFTVAGEPRTPYRKKFLEMKAKKMAIAMSKARNKTKQQKKKQRHGLKQEEPMASVSPERTPPRSNFPRNHQRAEGSAIHPTWKKNFTHGPASQVNGTQRLGMNSELEILRRKLDSIQGQVDRQDKAIDEKLDAKLDEKLVPLVDAVHRTLGEATKNI